MAHRTARGYNKVDWPFLSRFTDGTTPSYPLRAAKFLPVWAVDKLHNDPITIPPGTFVGRLNSTDNSGIDSSFTAEGYLAPACPVTYTVVYGSNDLEDAIDDGLWTPDIDADASTAVTATGAGATAVGVVKPCGITARPYYAGWLKDRFDNYDPHLLQTWISGLHVVRIPALSPKEWTVQAGDLVQMCSDATPIWNPGNLYAATSTPGRVEPFDAGALADMEYVVGRCVNKLRIARQASYSAGQRLSTAIGSGAPRSPANINTTDAYLWPEGENFKVQSKVEGVPGLSLSSTSATLGRPSELLWAYPDGNGDYWALDILLRV